MTMALPPETLAPRVRAADLRVPVVNWIERLLTALSIAFVVIPGATLAVILFQIVRRGAGAITWEFLSQAPSHGMAEGGIFPCIFGTLAITILMIMMALPLAVIFTSSES